MQKNDLLDLKKKIIGYSSLVLASTMTLSGCGMAKEEVEVDTRTAVEKMYQDNYDLLNNYDLYVIETENALGERKKNLVKILPYYELTRLDMEKYDIYSNFIKKHALFYIDIMTGDIISIEDNIVHSKEKRYLLSEVVDKKPAFNYASVYYGVQESYTYDQLYNMMNDLNNTQEVKQKQL